MSNDQAAPARCAGSPLRSSLEHEARAHYVRVMKDITFSADEEIIEPARDEARRRKIEGLFKQMDQYDLGGPYAREEMNT